MLLYPAGTRFYQSTHFTQSAEAVSTAAAVSDSGNVPTNAPGAALRLDCSGMQCPGPIMKVFETVQTMKDGETMEVSASGPGFARDIGAMKRPLS